MIYPTRGLLSFFFVCFDLTVLEIEPRALCMIGKYSTLSNALEFKTDGWEVGPSDRALA